MSTPKKSSSEKNSERDPDFINAEIALKHAARKGRRRALQTGIGVIVLQDGRIIEERPVDEKKNKFRSIF
jgi:hypothetical protein